jgi:hypothetical protein
MTMVRIAAAVPLSGRRVELTLTDGRVIERDLAPLLAGPIFDQIRLSDEGFAEMRVHNGTLTWPNGADLCPDVLIWGGLPPGDPISEAA